MGTITAQTLLDSVGTLPPVPTDPDVVRLLSSSVMGEYMYRRGYGELLQGVTQALWLSDSDLPAKAHITYVLSEEIAYVIPPLKRREEQRGISPVILRDVQEFPLRVAVVRNLLRILDLYSPPAFRPLLDPDDWDRPEYLTEEVNKIILVIMVVRASLRDTDAAVIRRGSQLDDGELLTRIPFADLNGLPMQWQVSAVLGELAMS